MTSVGEAWTTGRPWNPDALLLEKSSVGKPGRGRLNLRLAGLALNPVDHRLKQRWPIPLVGRCRLAFDFSGIVEEVGPGVTEWKPGDAVYGMAPPIGNGISSTVLQVSANWVARAPTSMPLSHAASVPLAGMTALQALRGMVGLREGQTLWINGASGGVGTFAVQLARNSGANPWVTCSPDNNENLKQLGATRMFNYRDGDFTEVPEKVDGVFDVRGYRSTAECARVVRPGGWVITTEPHLNVVVHPALNPFRSVRRYAVVVRPSPRDLKDLAAWIDDGSLVPQIDSVFDWKELPEAYKRQMSRKARGKIVVTAPS